MLLPSELEPTTHPVAVDTETSGLHPDDGATVATVSVAWVDENGHLHSYAWPFDQGMSDKQAVRGRKKDNRIGGQLGLGVLGLEDWNLPREQWDALLAWLSEHRLVFHNAPFDLKMLEAGTRHWPGRNLQRAVLADTGLVERCLVGSGGGGIGLDDATRRHGITGKEGLPALRKWLKQAKLPATRYDLAPWRVVEPYATADAEATIGLFYAQRNYIDAQQDDERDRLERLVEFEHEVMHTIIDMERVGMGFGVDAARVASARVREMADSAEALVPFKLRTLDGAKHYFYEDLGLQAKNETPTGRPQLKDEDVDYLAREQVPGAAEWQRLVKLRKADEMWYTGYSEKCGDDGRLRATLNQHSIVSGRFGCNRVNLQAIPHDYRLDDGLPSVRSLFRRRPGHRVFEIDLSQAEVRVGAAVAGCSAMLEVINRDGDIHGETASAMFRVQPDGDNWTELRQLAKRCNFSLQYGVGAKTFTRTMRQEGYHDFKEHEARDLIMRWRGIYPEFQQMIRNVERVVQRRARRYGRGWVECPGGWRRYFTPVEIARGDTHKAYNQLIQGTIGVIVKRWLVDIRSQYPGALVMTTHDSATVELPEETAEHDAHLIAIMGAQVAMEATGGKIQMEAEAKEWKLQAA